METSERKLEARAAIAAASVVLLVLAVLRLGWLSDDAFISFRAASNLVHGHGLVSNVGERVQGFTNPLWTLVVAAALALTPDIYLAAIVLCLVCTLGVGVLLATRPGAGWGAALAPLLLALSTSYTAFSTSGLENSLAHLLLAAFAVERFRAVPSSRRVWLLMGLIALNRLDHALLVVPVMAHEAYWAVRTKRHWRLLGDAAWGLAPLILWLAWATFYYGFPFPNTAYAKLNLEVPRGTLLLQGLAYVVDVALRDPLVPLVIGVGAVFAWHERREHGEAVRLLTGAALYLLYVVNIGGDFMSGRFFTAPYLLAVIVVADALSRWGDVPVAAGAGLGLVLSGAVLEPLPADVGTHCVVPPTGIVDERACYVEHTGIAQNMRVKKYKTHDYYKKGDEFRKANGPVVNNLVGMGGFAGGPQVYVVDEFALTDPLLARLKFAAGEGWRVGHFRRAPPAGYLDTLKTGENRIADPCARALLDDLRLVTRAPLFTPARFGTIAKLNLWGGTCPAPAP